MNATDSIKLPVTLIFSLDGKLVSFSHTLNSILKLGTNFQEMSTFPFSTLTSDSDQKDLTINFYNETFSFHHHIMRDPSKHPLAIIITLLDNQIKSPEVDEKIIQMDRLAQVGQLAASIAHEIRNPLAGINANIQVLSEMLQDFHEASPFFEIILEEIDRVDKIIKELLNYSRPQKPELKPTSLKKVMKHVRTLISAQLSKQKIKLITNEHEKHPELLADFGQMIQIFLNCILNSSQAMSDGGIIEMYGEAIPEQKEYQISIKDNGVGICQKDLNKIFNPFYTTKTKGLGLGLNVTKKLMDNHGASISISSIEGQGTTIKLMFPLNNTI